MPKQRREGEANSPARAKTGQRKLRKPSWAELVRLADQAVVAFAGVGMGNRAEPRACGCSRRSGRLDTKWPETGERQLLRQTQPGRASKGRARTSLASSRTGENPPYGMNRGGGGNIGMTLGLLATMPETADAQEAIGLNSDAPPLHSTSNCRGGIRRTGFHDQNMRNQMRVSYAALQHPPRGAIAAVPAAQLVCRGLAVGP